MLRTTPADAAERAGRPDPEGPRCPRRAGLRYGVPTPPECLVSQHTGWLLERGDVIS